MKGNFLFRIAFFAFVISILFASCKKKEEKQTGCVERIDPACICSQEYAPVCGCNNKTYSNACTATCSGITEYTQGECK